MPLHRRAVNDIQLAHSLTFFSYQHLPHPAATGITIDMKTAQYEQGVFKVQVSNPFIPCASTKNSHGTRLALNNIEARLKVLFGPKARLIIQQQLNRYTVSLSYPCSRPSAEATTTDENFNR